MELKQFESDLEGLIGRPSTLRPFICEGSPLACHVFVVGVNPATKMRGDFWDYWRSGVGFNKDAWFDAYLRDRASQPLKPGRTRRQAISNTRRLLDVVVESAKPVRCLETNLFAEATSSASELSVACRSTVAFKFLLGTIQPSLIVAHGAETKSYFVNRTVSQEIWFERHLSRTWSSADAHELGQRIRACFSDRPNGDD